MLIKDLCIRKQMKGKIALSAVVILLTAFFSPNIKCQQAGSVQPLGEDIAVKRFYSSAVDEKNVVWFLTEAGIVSFNGSKWALHNKNRKVASGDLKDIAYDFSSYGPELWIASPVGATVVSTPVDARSGATTYYQDNSKILSDNVLAVAIGKKELRWFGTGKGVSAFKSRQWLTNDYNRRYLKAFPGLPDHIHGYKC
jgi:ligand-binding sensor domain-containing protein